LAEVSPVTKLESSHRDFLTTRNALLKQHSALLSQLGAYLDQAKDVGTPDNELETFLVTLKDIAPFNHDSQVGALAQLFLTKFGKRGNTLLTKVDKAFTLRNAIKNLEKGSE
jgi:hypothetical protein